VIFEICFEGVNLKWPKGVSFAGFYTLYAVEEKDNPSHITILAYKAHLQTPHFIKYKNHYKRNG